MFIGRHFICRWSITFPLMHLEAHMHLGSCISLSMVEWSVMGKFPMVLSERLFVREEKIHSWCPIRKEGIKEYSFCASRYVPRTRHYKLHQYFPMLMCCHRGCSSEGKVKIKGSLQQWSSYSDIKRDYCQRGGMSSLLYVSMERYWWGIFHSWKMFLWKTSYLWGCWSMRVKGSNKPTWTCHILELVM